VAWHGLARRGKARRGVAWLGTAWLGKAGFSTRNRYSVAVTGPGADKVEAG